jgi:hypothetical protein
MQKKGFLKNKYNFHFHENVHIQKHFSVNVCIFCITLRDFVEFFPQNNIFAKKVKATQNFIFVSLFFSFLNQSRTFIVLISG